MACTEMSKYTIISSTWPHPYKLLFMLNSTEDEISTAHKMLTTVDPQERRTWISGVRSAMREASQLPGRGPLMWMVHLHVNQKSDYDDYDKN